MKKSTKIIASVAIAVVLVAGIVTTAIGFTTAMISKTNKYLNRERLCNQQN